MSMIALAFAYLRRRWGQALLSVIVGALGIAAVATAVVGVARSSEIGPSDTGKTLTFMFS